MENISDPPMTGYDNGFDVEINIFSDEPKELGCEFTLCPAKAVASAKIGEVDYPLQGLWVSVCQDHKNDEDYFTAYFQKLEDLRNEH